jgi:hypothetical protein
VLLGPALGELDWPIALYAVLSYAACPAERIITSLAEGTATCGTAPLVAAL